jgi:hypothetical protein
MRRTSSFRTVIAKDNELFGLQIDTSLTASQACCTRIGRQTVNVYLTLGACILR